MKKLGMLLLALAVLVLAPQGASAQRPPGRGSGGFGGMGRNRLFLLTQKSVQEELKLSADQVTQITQLYEKQRDSLRSLRDLSREEREKQFAERAKADEAAIAGILKEDQLKRYKQISLQQRGGWALDDPEVAQSLQLSDEQKQRVKEMIDAARGEMRALGEGGDREEMRKKFESLRKATDEKLQSLLTPEQQAKWKELAGEPFKGEIRPPEFRGGNRRAGRT